MQRSNVYEVLILIFILLSASCSSTSVYVSETTVVNPIEPDLKICDPDVIDPVNFRNLPVRYGVSSKAYNEVRMNIAGCVNYLVPVAKSNYSSAVFYEKKATKNLFKGMGWGAGILVIIEAVVAVAIFG